MSVLFINKESITVNDFVEQCQRAHLPPKNVVFLFPGNPNHRLQQLFSIKRGTGLAQLAEELGHAGYPTLSLPTTGVEQWETNPDHQGYVKAALRDVYLAVGQGYSIMLPVRNHTNNDYFDEPLENNVEPRFYHGVQISANKELAAHYIKEFRLLFNFIRALPRMGDTPYALPDMDPEFFSAYQMGTQAPISDLEPQTIQAQQQNTTQTPSTSYNLLQIVGGILEVAGAATVLIAAIALSLYFGIVGAATLLVGYGLFKLGQQESPEPHNAEQTNPFSNR